MKTIVIYNSQTGFTQQYAGWTAARVEAELLTLKEAKKKDPSYFATFDTIVYGGWVMAGTVVDSKWFLEKAAEWKNKKLAVFAVGASPACIPEVNEILANLLNKEQRSYIKAFYFQGGLNYERMKPLSKMFMKGYASSLKKKKDATETEKDMAAIIDHSYDSSDEKFIEPLVEYLLN